MSANPFLRVLHRQTIELRQAVHNWSRLPGEALRQQPAPGSWNMVQCLDHLNGYGQYYLPHLENAVHFSGHETGPVFRSGWLGNYFANSMEPMPNGKPKFRMKAFRNHTPANDLDADSVLQTFITQQDMLLRLMEIGHRVNLNPRVIPMSIASCVKLKTGDVFRFLIAHNRRHVAQAKRAFAAVGLPEPTVMNEAIRPLGARLPFFQNLDLHQDFPSRPD